MNPRVMFILVPALVMILMTTNTQSSDSEVRYADAYLQALEEIELNQTAAQPDSERIAAEFLDMFAHMTDGGTAERVRALYAERLYFNDTIDTLRDREALAVYLAGTADKVDHIEVQLLSVMNDGPHLYLRWLMDLEFSIMGRDRQTRTIGMSHLVVNEQQRIILHQDYWDGVEGIYRHVPLVGRFLESR